MVYNPKSRPPAYEDNDSWDNEENELLDAEDSCLEEEDEDTGCSECSV